MRSLNFFALVLLALLALSCSGSDEPVDPTDLNVTLADSGKTHSLVDDLRLLNGATDVQPLENGNLLIADSSPSIALFEDHRMVRTFGRGGQGPCEYSRFIKLDATSDSLFVFSFQQAKIITFRISTGECLGETSHESLSRGSYIARAGGAFYTAQTRYARGTPDSTRLLFRHAEDGEPIPLPVTKQMVNPAEAPVPMTYPAQEFARAGDRIFAFFPFSNIMVSYDAGSRQVSTIPMRLNVPRERIKAANDDPQKVIEILNNELEFSWNIFANEEWVIATVIHPNGPNGDQTRGLQFYTHSGDFIGEVAVEERPVALHNNRLIFIRSVSDSTADYTWEAEYREFTVE